MVKGSRNRKGKSKACIVADMDFDDILNDTHGFVASVERTSVDRRRVYQLPVAMPMPSPLKKRRWVDAPEDIVKDQYSDNFVSLGIDESLFYDQACQDGDNYDSSKEKHAK